MPLPNQSILLTKSRIDDSVDVPARTRQSDWFDAQFADTSATGHRDGSDEPVAKQLSGNRHGTDSMIQTELEAVYDSHYWSNWK